MNYEFRLPKQAESLSNEALDYLFHLIDARIYRGLEGDLQKAEDYAAVLPIAEDFARQVSVPSAAIKIEIADGKIVHFGIRRRK